MSIVLDDEDVRFMQLSLPVNNMVAKVGAKIARSYAWPDGDPVDGFYWVHTDSGEYVFHGTLARDMKFTDYAKRKYPEEFL